MKTRNSMNASTTWMGAMTLLPALLLGCSGGDEGSSNRDADSKSEYGSPPGAEGDEQSGLSSSGGTDSDAAASGGTDAGGTDAGGDVGDLGPCDGTADECEAARIINEYRAGHLQEGECNTALQWSSKIGKLAHDWQQQMGASIAHSSHGYVENVGQAYGLRDTVEYIIEYDPAIGEDHCNADGSYEASHHCAAMFCANKTVGIGVYQEGEAYYITMMFGGEDGEPDWGF